MVFKKFVKYYMSENGDWPDGVVEPWEKKMELVNKKHKLIITDSDINAYSLANGVSFDEAKDILNRKNDAEPMWIDQIRADYWQGIADECDKAIRDYFVDKKIFITDYAHQSEVSEGVPVCEDSDGKLYASTYTLRAWGGLMAECWNKILDISSLDYIDFYCGGEPKEVVEYLKANHLANADQWHTIGE